MELITKSVTRTVEVLSEDISRVVFHTMPVKEFHKLIFESPLAVMFLLPVDVIDDTLNL